MEKLKAEASGILAWLVEGAVRWNNRTAAIQIPQRVQNLRVMYMSDTDMFADFVSDVLKRMPESSSKVSSLHRAYGDFCKSRGVQAPLMSAFKQELRANNMISNDGKLVPGFVINTDFATFEL